MKILLYQAGSLISSFRAWEVLKITAGGEGVIVVTAWDGWEVYGDMIKFE